MATDTVETAIGAVFGAEHGQTVKRDAFRWACVVIDGTEREAGHRTSAGRHWHHGGQD